MEEEKNVSSAQQRQYKNRSWGETGHVEKRKSMMKWNDEGLKVVTVFFLHPNERRCSLGIAGESERKQSRAAAAASRCTHTIWTEDVIRLLLFLLLCRTVLLLFFLFLTVTLDVGYLRYDGRR